MKTNRIFYQILLTCCLFVFVASSCRKTPEEIGDNLLPEGDFLKASFYGDSTITAYSVLYDSIGSGSQTYALLGSMVDEVFGATQAGFYTQIIPATKNPDFGQSVVIDSVIWEMVYGGAYGDTLTNQTMHVYRITDENYTDSVPCYSYSEFAIDNSIDYAQAKQFAPRPHSPYVVGTDTSSIPTLRVKLDNNLAQTIMLDASNDSLAMSSSTEFTKFFKGLYVTCDELSSGGAISYMYLISSSSEITVYYRNEESQDSTLKYYFSTTTKQRRCNVFNHDYSLGSAEFVNQVINNDTSLGGQRLYIQSMGGVRTRFKLHNFEKWQDTTDKKVIINEAKLIMNTAESDSSVYTAPKQLALLILKNEVGDSTGIPLDSYVSTNYYGGTYSNGIISFRITQYVQDLVQAGANLDDNYGMYVLISGASNNAQRWVFNGPKAAENPMRLEVTYSLVDYQ